MRNRIIGEWRALRAFVGSVDRSLKCLCDDIGDAWWNWRVERPFFLCTRCGKWFEKPNVELSGLCGWCADEVIPYEVRKQRWIEKNGPLGEDEVWF